MTKIRKNLNLIAGLLMLAVVIAAALSTGIIAYGVWVEDISPVKSKPVRTAEINPSEKHIVYAALDASGNFIPEAEEGTTAVVSFAAIGYGGLVETLQISDRYAIEVDGTVTDYPVTAVLALADDDIPDYLCYIGGSTTIVYSQNEEQTEYVETVEYTAGTRYEDADAMAFRGNEIVERLTISSSVSRIGAGVFSNMPNLKYADITGLGNITIGDHAFAGCAALADGNFKKTKLILGNFATIFAFTGITATDNNNWVS